MKLRPWGILIVGLLAACREAEHSDHHSEPAGEAEAEVIGLRLSQPQIAAAGIELAEAGPASIREELSLYGTIVPNAERVRQVTARFPGVIQNIAKRVGDRVAAGERLATIESNESLKSYAVTSPLAGVVTQRMANEGEQAGGSPLFTVADLASVWAEIALFPRDVSKVRVGQSVQVRSGDEVEGVTGRIVYLAPLGSTANQTITGRVLLDNSEGRWAPGLFISAAVLISEAPAAVAVRNSALQTLQTGPAVFVRTAQGFEPRAVRLGRRDAHLSEVLSGVQAGERYAAANSFILKAELGKAEVEHEH
jgi:membrane fusion protein, heavy metal efflux system